MAIPEAVRKQAEEAEKALDQFTEKQSLESAEPEETAEVEAGTQSGQPEKPAEEAPVSNELSDLQKQLELERQRNRSLQGRIDSQLAAANSENKELKSMIGELKAQMDELRKANAVPGYRRHITEEEAADLGDDVLEVQERIIKGTLEEELENGSVKEFIERLVKQSAEAQRVEPATNPVNLKLFWQAVERYYPNAETIDGSDEGWFAFLDSYDPKSGLKNRQLGEQIINSGDVAGMVDLMSTYKAVGGHVGSERRPSVKPERTGSEPVVETVKSTWKREEVERFYHDVAMKKFRGTKEQAIAMEKEIMEAAQEGRIIG